MLLFFIYYYLNNQEELTMAKTTVQLHLLTGEKLKAISKKRKENAEYPSKQVEIITDFINKLYEKECK